MNYPTRKQAETANHEELCRWYRFLPMPSNNEEMTIMTTIYERFHQNGGFTPEMSKKLGWKL